MIHQDLQQAIKNAKLLAQQENRPIAILFVCLGNICRSPAAEGVFRKMAQDAGLDNNFILDSCGFYGGHAGDLPDLRMRRAAIHRGYSLDHRSRTIKAYDFEQFDLIFGMDDRNISDLFDAAPTLELQKKIFRMVELAKHFPNATSVPDPYYEGADGFYLVLDLLEDACQNLLNLLSE